MIVQRAPDPPPSLPVPEETPPVFDLRRRIGLVGGPLLFALILLLPIEGLQGPARAGFALNWLGVLLITLAAYLLAIPVFRIVLGMVPVWA